VKILALMAASTVPLLATAGDDIKLWNVDSFTANHQFNPHRSHTTLVSSLSWSPDGNVSFICWTFRGGLSRMVLASL